MKADVASLLTDFLRKASGTQYSIPVYQRNYTWTKNKQIKELFIDIDKLLEGVMDIHFIGTIVYLNTNNSLNSIERSIVDGQQRLTTIFLMLYAIKHIALDKGEVEFANKIKDLYLENRHTAEKYKFRLKPLITDDNVYEYICRNDIKNIKEKESKVYINYNYIKEEIVNRLKKYNFDDILNAINKLNVVYIQLDQSDNAQQIFESINSTGVELNAADLIRNFILMNHDNMKQEELYKDYWLKIENTFTDSKIMEEFFRFYLSTVKYELINKKHVYGEFKIFFNNKIKNTNLVKILNEIIDYCNAYSELYLLNNQTNQSIIDYRRIQSNIPTPLLLELLVMKNKDIINEGTFNEALHIVNSFMIRRHMAGLDTSSITRLFPSILKNLELNKEDFKEKDLIENLKYVLVNQNKLNNSKMPTDNEIRLYLENANAYNFKKNLKFVLEKIENNGNRAKIIDFKDINIEHIMPQNADKEGYWKNNIPNDEEYDKYLNKLGNLTLVDRRDNSEMGNKDFNSKKQVISKTRHIKINEDILNQTEWTKEIIDKRNNNLINKFIEIFKYFHSNTIRKNKIIILKSNTLNARAIYYNKKHFELLLGSEIKSVDFNDNINDTKVLNIREKDKENNFLEEIDGEIKLIKNKGFKSLPLLTEYIVGTGCNAWDLWIYEDGKNFKKIN